MAVRGRITVPGLVFPVVLLTVLSGVLFSGIRAPGEYCGVVVYDRWDGCTLCSGSYIMYISESIKDLLRPYAGKCIQIYAREVTQPQNPGDGLISDFEYLGPAPPANSGLSLQGIDLRTAPAFSNGERPRVRISFRNSGDLDATIGAGFLAPTLLTKKSEKALLRPFRWALLCSCDTSALEIKPGSRDQDERQRGAWRQILLVESGGTNSGHGQPETGRRVLRDDFF